MRLPTERVKDGLLHPDKTVRTEVAYYFSQSFSQDPLVMPLVSRAIEQYGWSEAFDHYTFLAGLVQTEESVCWLIRQLRHWVATSDEANIHRRRSLQAALIAADPLLLQPHAREIMDLDALDAEGRDAADEQFSMPSQSAVELWKEVEEWCDLYEDDECVDQEMLGLGNRLVKALAKYPDKVEERVLSILRTDRPGDEYWMTLFAICLAGEMRLEIAVPSLVMTLHSSGEIFSDEICEALAKIGTRSVVAILAAEFPNGDWDFRLFVACLLEHIRSDSSVTACLDLQSRETDHVVRCHLLQSALLNFATEAIEPARQYVLAMPKDPDLLEVRMCLLVACKLTGEPLPEFDEWDADSKTDQDFRRAWYKDHPLSMDAGANALDVDSADDTWTDDGFLDDEFLGDDELQSAPSVLVRRTERVGRNDPCPCGSGKKFKKCCYGKASMALETDVDHAAAMSGIRPPKSSPRYPIGTLALYGPDDRRTTKIVAAVIKSDGAEPILQRWVGNNIKDNPKVRRQIDGYFRMHQVRSVVATDRNIGCPHEEGEDFPLGEDCPFCPFWKGKQGSARSE